MIGEAEVLFFSGLILWDCVDMGIRCMRKVNHITRNR